MDLHEFGRILTANRKPNGEFSPEAVAAITALYIAGTPRKDIADAFDMPRPATVNNLIDASAIPT
ncbi:uncharacterized protein PG986_013262 [Apiospora aurea]|uniref:Uncharacterized protein n=1 Tax=Apiospora aurea TaxID=335848 RepID=A0ABR1PV37_9PEZI